MALIEKLGHQLTESEKDRDERLTQLEKVNKHLEQVESDRNDRLNLIEKLNKQLTEVEKDQLERLKQIKQLSNELHETNDLLNLYKETMNNSWYGRHLLKKLGKKREDKWHVLQ